MLIEYFLGFNNGSQVNVLPWKLCSQENPSNCLELIKEVISYISVQAEFEHLENAQNSYVFSICEHFY